MPPEQKDIFHTSLSNHLECFAKNSPDLGHCKTISHQINTEQAKPIHQEPYPSAFKQIELLQKQVTEMLKDGVIEPSCSPWSSPGILMKKKDGNYRFCAHYIKLNSVTVKDVYPLPRIDDALSRLAKTKYYSIMDMQSGFWQVEVTPESREKTAFITPDGHLAIQKNAFRTMQFSSNISMDDGYSLDGS